MPNDKELDEQINVVSRLTSLSPYVIEKDLMVTKAIAIITAVSNELYDLIFQGGTSLSKAFRILERMSEDCDFRIHFKGKQKISKEKLRRTLRTFRHDLLNKLKENSFRIEKDDIKVRNEGQFIHIRANYDSMYPLTEGVKPYIALEFFLGSVKKNPILKPVTTLIKNILGDKVSFEEHEVLCLDIVETAAEKWVGLTRRVATSKHREYYKDPNLVRHLYDLYKINKNGYLSSDFPNLVGQILLMDRQHFKNHNDDYYKNPISEIKRATEELKNSKEWHENWDVFSDAMIYEKNKPSYNDVMNNFLKISDDVIHKIDDIELN